MKISPTIQRAVATVLTLSVVVVAYGYLTKSPSEGFSSKAGDTANALALQTGDADNPNDTIRVLKENAETATNQAKAAVSAFEILRSETATTIDALKTQIKRQGENSTQRSEAIQNEIAQQFKNFSALMAGQKNTQDAVPQTAFDDDEWVVIEPMNTMKTQAYQVEKANYDVGGITGDTDFLFADAPVSTTNDDEQFVPIATIPKNSIILNARTLTTLIGRIPFDRSVFEAYEFSVITSADNFTPHDHEVPFLESAIWSGIATGDKDLRCIRGEITSVTFVFTDGTILTRDQASGKPLATITTDNGTSCVPGEYVTNLPKYLAALGLTGAVAGIGEAVADDETVKNFTSDGNVLTTVTGDTAKFIAGRAIEKSATAMSRIIEREYANSYAAVVKQPGQNISMIMKEQVNIDYNLNARKVSYVNPEDYDYE